MADIPQSTRLIPNGKKRRGGRENAREMDMLSKSVPTSFYARRDPPPAPRHRPLKSREDPESLELPPPSPLDDNKIQEVIRLGRSLSKTTPSQLLYPSSLPTQFMMNNKRLKALSLSTKKEPSMEDNDASPSSSVNSEKQEAEPPAPVGSLSSTLKQILEEDAKGLGSIKEVAQPAAPIQTITAVEEDIPQMTLDFEDD